MKRHQAVKIKKVSKHKKDKFFMLSIDVENLSINAFKISEKDKLILRFYDLQDFVWFVVFVAGELLLRNQLVWVICSVISAIVLFNLWFHKVYKKRQVIKRIELNRDSLKGFLQKKLINTQRSFSLCALSVLVSKGILNIQEFQLSTIYTIYGILFGLTLFLVARITYFSRKKTKLLSV